MCTRRNFRVFKEQCFFSSLWLVVFILNGMETRESIEGDAVVFMALKSLCRFFCLGCVCCYGY
jgi:hypothetical protein